MFLGMSLNDQLITPVDGCLQTTFDTHFHIAQNTHTLIYIHLLPIDLKAGQLRQLICMGFDD
jgi:hypothetical protein